MTTGSKTYRNSADAYLPQGLVYPELMHTGFTETLVQNTNAFNAASQGAIAMIPEFKQGDFVNESFFQTIGNLVSRRAVDAGSPNDDALTPLNLTLDELVSPTLNRRIGPVRATLDSFRKIGRTAGPEEISLAIGEQIAKAVQVDWLDTALLSLVAATKAQAAMVNDYGSGVSPQRTATTNDLVDTVAKFGDQLGAVRLWVMHSTVYFALVKSQITANIDGISSFNVREGSPVTLGVPVLVTDSSALSAVGSPGETTEYHTLALTQGGITIFQAPGAPLIDVDVIHGKENLEVDLQGEHEYQVRLKGYRYDATNGGVNPSDSVLGTGSNWDKAVTSNKDLAAALLQTIG